MEINVEGKGGAYREVLRGRRVIELGEEVAIRVETLDGGLQSGAPSVAIILELPKEGGVVVAQTSVRLFQTAAFAMVGKYGNLADDAFRLELPRDGGAARMTFSMQKCGACKRSILEDCRYCPQCGVAL